MRSVLIACTLLSLPATAAAQTGAQNSAQAAYGTRVTTSSQTAAPISVSSRRLNTRINSRINTRVERAQPGNADPTAAFTAAQQEQTRQAAPVPVPQVEDGEP
jgi:hypothetical protein